MTLNTVEKAGKRLWRVRCPVSRSGPKGDQYGWWTWQPAHSNPQATQLWGGMKEQRTHALYACAKKSFVKLRTIYTSCGDIPYKFSAPFHSRAPCSAILIVVLSFCYSTSHYYNNATAHRGFSTSLLFIFEELVVFLMYARLCRSMTCCFWDWELKETDRFNNPPAHAHKG